MKISKETRSKINRLIARFPFGFSWSGEKSDYRPDGLHPAFPLRPKWVIGIRGNVNCWSGGMSSIKGQRFVCIKLGYSSPNDKPCPNLWTEMTLSTITTDEKLTFWSEKLLTGTL